MNLTRPYNSQLIPISLRRQATRARPDSSGWRAPLVVASPWAWEVGGHSGLFLLLAYRVTGKPQPCERRGMATGDAGGSSFGTFQGIFSCSQFSVSLLSNMTGLLTFGPERSVILSFFLLPLLYSHSPPLLDEDEARHQGSQPTVDCLFCAETCNFGLSTLRPR